MKGRIYHILRLCNILLMPQVMCPLCLCTPCSRHSSTTLTLTLTPTLQQLNLLTLLTLYPHPTTDQDSLPHTLLTPITPTHRIHRIHCHSHRHYHTILRCIPPHTCPHNNPIRDRSQKLLISITCRPPCHTITPINSHINTHSHIHIRMGCLHLPQGWALRVRGMACILILLLPLSPCL